MKRLKYIYNKVWALSLLCLLGTACSDELPTSGYEEERAGLVMQLQIDGNAVLTPSASTRIAADPTLNETLVEQVDVFFSTDGTNIETDHYIHANMGADNRLVLAGADWKQQFPASSYQVYVVANLHTYDNPATPDAVETDLSWITTVDQLRALTDTDNEVRHAEGEIILGTSEDESTTYTGKTFLMDATTTWTPPTTDDATIEVDLKRAAAKIVVNVSYSDKFVKDDVSIVNLRKKVVHYVPQALALAEAPYQEMEVRGDAGASGFSNPDYTNDGSDANRIDILYAYTYPNQWGENMERETYLLVNIPYNDDSTGENVYYGQNYYKVPVRFSADADELRLDRNMQYTVNVTIDRKGNEEIDEPVELKPTFNVAPWKTVNIDVDNDSPNYLVLSDYDIEMHNEESVTIQFYSSSPLAGTDDNPAGVRITDAYFIDKNGTETREQLIEDNRGEWNDVYQDVADFCSVEWNENTLTGTITFRGEIPTNVTTRYVTLEVRNTDIDPVTGELSPTIREVKITQYPLEYIMGVEGVYSTRTDFEKMGNTYVNYVEQNWVRDYNNDNNLDNDTFRSKVSVNGSTYYVRIRNNRLGSGDRVSSLDNNRMYLVQITSTGGTIGSTNEEYVIARPKMDGEGENIVTHSSDENNRLVSPAFMLASQLGAVQPSNWNEAQEQCREYVEIAEYSDGETRRFADWRLPTYQELRIIGKYQNEQPEVMDEVLGGDYYWSAYDGRAWRKSQPDNTNPTQPGRNTYVYIRCIRDVTPDDLKEFTYHGIR